jgi:hypothetical protein
MRLCGGGLPASNFSIARQSRSHLNPANPKGEVVSEAKRIGASSK